MPNDSELMQFLRRLKQLAIEATLADDPALKHVDTAVHIHPSGPSETTAKMDGAPTRKFTWTHQDAADLQARSIRSEEGDLF